MQEIWKDIEGYKGYYQVSNVGRVKSLPRVVYHSYSGKRTIKERIVRPSIDTKGYYHVTLHKCGIRKNMTVHQLVAIAFLNHKPCGYKLVVNHKDFNPLNNNETNLEIVTHRENTNKKHIPHSSKYTGVSWSKVAKKWVSQIVIKSDIKNLGYYTNEYDAHIAYENYKKIITNG